MVNPSPLYASIINEIDRLNPDTIPLDRKANLQPLIDYIQFKVNYNHPVRINFICTHNSRRSHFSQIWAQTLAHYFQLSNIFCYSSGTVATALFPKVIETLKLTGFVIEILSNEENPVYAIKYAKNEPPVIGYSKTINDIINPTSHFVAVMTCTQAEEECPIVSGAEKRISIPFEDPKVYDNTPEQANKYKERSLQIATELFYIFSQIKTKK